MSSSMEDCGLLAVDCVVVCCCCPCLLLQVTVFLLIRLPRKLAAKSKRIVLRRLRKGLKKSACRIRGIEEKAAFGSAQEGYDLTEGHLCIGDRNSFLEAEKLLQELMMGEGSSSWVEANKVWEELVAEEGLLWFGSFWGITS